MRTASSRRSAIAPETASSRATATLGIRALQGAESPIQLGNAPVVSAAIESAACHRAPWSSQWGVNHASTTLCWESWARTTRNQGR